MRCWILIELVLLLPMLCDPSLLCRRYPKFDLCHQNRYLRHREFCKSSDEDRKIAAVDLAFYLESRSTEPRAGGCLAARNPKGGERSSVIPDGDPNSSAPFSRV